MMFCSSPRLLLVCVMCIRDAFIRINPSGPAVAEEGPVVVVVVPDANQR